MSLLRKFFYKKPPEGLLEISERVFVFDCCFSIDVLEEDEYKTYMGGIVGKLCEHFPDATFMVFNFREGESQSQMESILNDYEMTVVNYPRQYENCPILTMEMIHHFLKSTESWLSIGMTNVLLMHCERGGWPVLAFMLAAFLIYRKQFNGEQKTLDMIYKQAPRELLHLMSPLNPLPSQLRYVQYVSRRKVDSEWPPLDRALTLDCVILRAIPNMDGKGGCRPIFRIYGQDPFMAADRTPKVLFSTGKRSKTVRHHKQADCELVKIDIYCHILGDVVLECITLDDDLEREEMMFRVMFNTGFIRSNVLMLNRDEIDTLWSVKDQFPKDFRAEILFSEMDSYSSSITTPALSSVEEKGGLPVEAFAKCQELFSIVDWLAPSIDVTLNSLQIRAANILQEKLETSSPLAVGKEKLVKSSNQILKNEKMEQARQIETESSIPEKLKGNIAGIDLPGSKDGLLPSEPYNERVTETPDSMQLDNDSRAASAPPLEQTMSSSNLMESNHEIPKSTQLDNENNAYRPDHAESKIRVSPCQSPTSAQFPLETPLCPQPLLKCSSLDGKTSQAPVHLSPPPPTSPTVPAPIPLSSDLSMVSFPSSPKVAFSTSRAPSLPLPPTSCSSSDSIPNAAPQSPPLSPHWELQSIPTTTGHPSQSESSASLCPPPACSGSDTFPTASSSPLPPSPCLELKSITPPPPPCLESNSIPLPAPPCLESKSIPLPPIPLQPPPCLESKSIPTATAPIPPPPSGSISTVKSSPPPPPAPHSGSGLIPSPPPPSSRPESNANAMSSATPPVPPPPVPFPSGLSKANGVSLQLNSAAKGSIPPPPFGAKGKFPSRTSLRNPNQSKRTPLKPYHWLKLTRVMQGSLWAETQKPEDPSQAPEFDMSELESLFSATVPDSGHRSGGGKSGHAAGTKSDKVHLIDLRRAYNCEIMLTKVKIPLSDLMSSVLALDDSALDTDQVDNLIKFCPTKEEMELLKNYKGEKENLGKCEQFFLELMKVPRVESKLRVFSFKIQFSFQVSDLRNSLNIVNSASEEVQSSVKLRRIMQTILSLGNALNQGTARGSAVGFRLDSLLKLTDTRSRNNKMTLMHYLCKVLAEKLPELLDFPKGLANLEAATKIQLKYLAEEMQAISKGLEKVVQELAASENDGPVSEIFCMNLKMFLSYAEKEVKSVSSLYSEVGRNCDALPIYFGEDPARCPFEQAVSTLLNFVKMFKKAHEENCKQLEFERKKALKEAENEKAQLRAAGMELLGDEKDIDKCFR